MGRYPYFLLFESRGIVYLGISGVAGKCSTRERAALDLSVSDFTQHGIIISHDAARVEFERNAVVGFVGDDCCAFAHFQHPARPIGRLRGDLEDTGVGLVKSE